ncbi:hypothetical protein CFIO01_02292 [Colletotrichum fioriniae PJ7]|uniref:Uncharacterized protein n=1 Tax=Colletotrichum fioriniae PJ7 TaxID=1445577 RepID=A0A010SMT6_9PEZI|nr:hypothetical protein CFIO01_02292 [Colletotrichum fioriniae PJ7]
MDYGGGDDATLDLDSLSWENLEFDFNVLSDTFFSPNLGDGETDDACASSDATRVEDDDGVDGPEPFCWGTTNNNQTTDQGLDAFDTLLGLDFEEGDFSFDWLDLPSRDVDESRSCLVGTSIPESVGPEASPVVFLSCTVVGCNQVFSDEKEWAEHTRGRLCLPEKVRSKYARGMRSELGARVARLFTRPYPGCGARRREQEAPVFSVQAGVPLAGRPEEAPEGDEGDVQVLGETERVAHKHYPSVAREWEEERSEAESVNWRVWN